MSSEESSEGIPGQAYRKVTRGEWWNRPTCWLFGHQLAYPEGVEICTRCDHGELDGEYLVESDLEIGELEERLKDAWE